MSLALFEAGSLICAVASSSTALIVGRAIAGVGDAGILAGNLNIISLSTTLEKRATYIGLVGSLYAMSYQASYYYKMSGIADSHPVL
jgi:MFS family permease